MTLLECTAGQGSCLGHRLEHLNEILAGVKQPARLAVCLEMMFERVSRRFRETSESEPRVPGQPGVRRKPGPKPG